MTSVMVTTLKRPRSYVILGSMIHLGDAAGPPPELVTKCLRRMALLTTLTNKVISAEFPDVELLNSFQVFSLSDDKRARDLTTSGTVCTFLGRLARALAFDPKELLQQYTLVEPYARKIHTAKGVSNFSAWKEATLWHRNKRKRGDESRRELSSAQSGRHQNSSSQVRSVC